MSSGRRRRPRTAFTAAMIAYHGDPGEAKAVRRAGEILFRMWRQE